MKFVINATFSIAAVLVPAVAFAQSTAPLTREQVRADLLNLENAGYNPLSSCTGDCPGSLRRAEAILAQRQNDPNAAYGPVSEGTEQVGR
jgi:hypothetical protein